MRAYSLTEETSFFRHHAAIHAEESFRDWLRQTLVLTDCFEQVLRQINIIF